MSATTWRKFGNQAFLWLLIMLAVQAVMYYAGWTPPPLPVVSATVVLGWAVMWVILRKNPNYYHRPRTLSEPSSAR